MKIEKHKERYKYKKVLFVEMKYPKKIKVPKEIEKDNSFFIHFRKQLPLDLLFPATILEKKGIKVSIIDLNVDSYGTLLEKAKYFKPDLVLLSTSYIGSWQCPLPPALLEKNSKKIREAFKCKFGVFGPHPTSLPEFILEKSHADFLIIGEPENPITNICKNGFKKTNNVAYFDKKKRIQMKKMFDPFNMEKMPVPDYGLIDLKKYEAAIIQSSRGCPGACLFCNKTMYGPGFRQRKIDDVIKEIEILKDFGFKSFYFQDLEFLFNEKRVEEFCKKVIKKRLNIKWSCTARVNSVKSLKVYKLMKNAGCDTINFGLESAANSILATSGKGITMQDVEESMTLCSRSGVKGAYNIIFGLPGENKKTMKETRKFIEKNYNKENIFIDRGFRIIYFPGTKLFDIALKQGKIKMKTIFDDIYLKSGTINTSFKSKKEFDNAFQFMRIKLFAFKKVKKIKSRIGALLDKGKIKKEN